MYKPIIEARMASFDFVEGDAQHDCLIKIRIVGDKQVGKSLLMRSFYFKDHTRSIDMIQANMVKIDDKIIKSWVCDRVDQKHMRGSSVSLLVFDLTNLKSFDAISDIMKDEERYTLSGSKFILVGNKSDLFQRRQVQSEAINNFCKKHGLLYIETSALNATNTGVLFEEAIRTGLAAINKKEYIPIENRNSASFSKKTVRTTIDRYLSVYNNRGKSYHLFPKSKARKDAITSLNQKLASLLDNSDAGEMLTEENKDLVFSILENAIAQVNQDHKKESLAGKWLGTQSRLASDLQKCLDELRDPKLQTETIRPVISQ